MMNFRRAEISEKLASPSLGEMVQILRDGFQPDELEQIVERLEQKGYLYNVFDGVENLPSALCHPRTGLLLAEATAESLDPLLEVIRANRKTSKDTPILLFCREDVSDKMEMLLCPEIDDYLLHPFNLADVQARIQRLLPPTRARHDEVEQVKLSLMADFGLRKFVGSSSAFTSEVEKIPRVAASGAPVLIIGETGTGKEMCARAIHYLSPRAKKPFIPVNCGSIPPDLFENEMFGHEPGAFTDARHSRRGLIAEAEGGTLFLDEVDSLPLSAQVKLLRFLQDWQYRPLGASGYRRANTRVLAASNQKLPEKIREGKFREDLYYRLRVVSLNLPSLRERPDDIVPLAQHFLDTSAIEYQSPVGRLSGEAMQKLTSYAWPGNIRELENVIRQAVVLATGGVLRAHDIHLPTDGERPVITRREPFKAAKARVIEAFERNYLSEIIDECGGNISRAAREAQKDRRAFFELLRKYGLTNGKFADAFRGQELEAAA